LKDSETFARNATTFPAFDLQVELVDFRDPQIAQRRGGGFNGCPGRVFPRSRARADDFRDAIDPGFGSFLAMSHSFC
jgi:hypothetical protein